MPAGEEADEDARGKEQCCSNDCTDTPFRPDRVTRALNRQGKGKGLAGQGEATGKEDENKLWREKTTEEVFFLRKNPDRAHL